MKYLSPFALSLMPFKKRPARPQYLPELFDKLQHDTLYQPAQDQTKGKENPMGYQSLNGKGLCRYQPLI